MIFKSFKIIVKGKKFWISAKEVTGWTPDFDKRDESFTDSDNDSLGVNSEEIKSKANSEVDSDVEKIPETIFEQGDQDRFKSKVTLKKSNDVQGGTQSVDLFNIYELLKKKKPSPSVSQQTEGEPKYPPDFTPKDVSEVDIFNIKSCWGNLAFDFVASYSVGNSGGILCVWDSNMFHKEHSTVSNYFIAIMGKWVQSDKNMLIISVYAPQELCEKKMLWQYLNHLIDRWKGEVIVMGDFNEVRNQEERFGSIFNVQGAASFNSFISSGGLVEVPSEGYSFTWCHKSASKMNKLDRFLISEGLMESCPNISAITLDRHLSDHRPIVLREINYDYGPTPFRFYHYWLLNKLRQLKKEIHSWVKDNKEKNKNEKQNLKTTLADIDLLLDKGDENSKYFHGIIKKHRSNLAIRGILVDGAWIEDPQV
uniref:RNA-directed DNA polymerase, eukaryota n=1 Tax=Tanacetum cinerariifolium TaxID=118510 RepID=A0A699GZL0_TANCI|nr:RNA-directed DNA polymerase, eukaryota [Tanacetum cinerariifolium]